MKIILIVLGVFFVAVCGLLIRANRIKRIKSGPYIKDTKHWKEHKKVFESTIIEYMSVKGYQKGEDYVFLNNVSDENTTIVCYEQEVFDAIKRLMQTRGYGVKNRFWKEIKSDDILIKAEETKLSENSIRIDYMDITSHRHIFSAVLMLKNMLTTITLEPEFFTLYAKEHSDVAKRIKDKFSKHFKHLPTQFDNFISIGRSYCLLMNYADKFSLVYNFNFDRENGIKRCYLLMEDNLPTVNNADKSRKEILKNMLEAGLIHEVDVFANREEKISTADLTHNEKILRRLKDIVENQNLKTMSVDEFMKRLG